MAAEPKRQCPECGAPVSPGELRCPEGHPCDDPLEASFLDTDAMTFPSDFGDIGPLEVNTLFECWVCNRLVETQTHQGLVVTPKFCPWCGRPVSSIIGRELDGYRIDEVISRGGFGTIYVASNIAQPTMKAAVKFLRTELCYRNPDLVGIFVEEARLTEAIGQTCWNIVRVSNVREKPWPYYFMEYVRGTTLEDVIESAAPERIPLREAIGYIRGIAKALVATHAHGRVHRDLKPLNIMVISSHEISQPEERVKLLDFGLAMKIAGRKATQRATADPISTLRGSGVSESPVQAAGTPEYMPPESFDGINEFGGDIYSFAVTAYEVLTGHRPWDDPSSKSDRFIYWRNCHKKRAARPIRSLRPEVPRWLSRLIMQCLDKDPKKRPQSFEHVLKQLKEPISLWIKLAAVAAALLFCFLIIRIITTPGQKPQPIRRWDVTVNGVARRPEATAASTLRIHVKGVRELPQMRVVLHLGEETGGELREWSFVDVKDANLHYDDWIDHEYRADGKGRRVELSFTENEALLGKTIRVASRGGGPGYEGTIHIHEDREGPELDAPGYVALADPASEEARLPAGSALPIELDRPESERRFNRQRARFVIQVLEDHPDTVELLAERTDGGGEVEPARGIHNEELGRWEFSLARFDDGDYRGWIVARDLAGSEARWPPGERPFLFSVDDAVEVDLAGSARAGEHPWLARGTFFYELDVSEEILDWRVQRVGAEDAEIESRLHVTEKSIRSLAELLNEMKDASDPGEVVPGKGFYFLAIPGVERHLRGAEGPELVVEVRDRATPPNRKPISLPLRPLPRPMTAAGVLEQIRSITIRAAGEAWATVAAGDLRARAQFSLELIEPLRPARGGLCELRIDMIDGDIYEIGHALNAGAEARVLRDPRGSFAFPPIPLASQDGRRTEETLLLKFYDRLGKPVDLSLALVADRVAPRILGLESVPRKMPEGYHPTGEVNVVLTSSESLSRVTYRLEEGWQDAVDAGLRRLPERGGRDSRYQFSLAGAALADGTHTVAVAVRDLAGNECEDPGTLELTVDQHDPVVEPLARPIAGTRNRFALTEPSFRMEIRDANGIAFERSRATIYAGGGVFPSDVVPEGEGAGDTVRRAAVPLAAVPDTRDGRIELEVYDSLGRLALETYHFSLETPEFHWPDVVDWKGLDWVHVPSARLYMTRTEIPNGIYRQPALLRDGFYGGEGHTPFGWRISAGQIDLPRFRVNGSYRGGDEFPVVGISPEAANEFARVVFERARLPTWGEFQLAAWMSGGNRKNPFRRDACNLKSSREVWRERGQISDTMEAWVEGRRQPIRVHLVPVGLAPSGEEWTDPGRLLHLVGNVGELVTLAGGGRPAWGGGHCDHEYERIDLRVDRPVPYSQPSYYVGFRLVLSVDGSVPVPAGFRARAEELRTAPRSPR